MRRVHRGVVMCDVLVMREAATPMHETLGGHAMAGCIQIFSEKRDARVDARAGGWRMAASHVI